MVKDGIVLGERYEILSKIGAGGMADVYKGRDNVLNRYVAVKVLKKEYREDETYVKKFRSEAQAAAGIMNPNIVNVYDVGVDRALLYGNGAGRGDHAERIYCEKTEAVAKRGDQHHAAGMCRNGSGT